jgi:histone-lysine N-methyltransferase SETMAR
LLRLRGKTSEKTPFIHHDNASAHNALSIQEFLAQKENIPVVSHPPYSPDLAPCNFFSLP